MMARFQISRIRFRQARQISIAVLLSVSLLSVSVSAIAHHMTDGKLPANFAGFMSGLGHPIIGFDHFAFIVAVGLQQ